MARLAAHLAQLATPLNRVGEQRSAASLPAALERYRRGLPAAYSAALHATHVAAAQEARVWLSLYPFIP